MAIYMVSGLIKIIRNKAIVLANFLIVENNKEIPIKNSTADKTIPPNKGKNEGNQEAIPNAVR